MTYQTAVDIARTEISHPSRAAHRLRDYALSCGAQNSLSVLVVSFTKGAVSAAKLRPQKREVTDSVKFLFSFLFFKIIIIITKKKKKKKSFN